MANGDFARPADELEFHPATPEQFERIGSLASRLLDGTVALAGRRHVVSGEYFESEFFHEWLAKYVHDGAVMDPIGAEEAEAMLVDQGQPLAMFPERARHNQVGMVLGLASSVGYDGGSLELATPINGSVLSFDIRPDSLVAEDDTDTFLEHVLGPHQDAGERQAQTMLEMVKLVTRLDETGSPAPLERSASISLRDLFNGFPIDEVEEDAGQATVVTLKTHLLNIVAQRSIRATFLRRFRSETSDTMVVAKLSMDQEGKYSRRYELQTRTPTTIDGFDSFVTGLEWDEDGERKHNAYFDVDLNAAIAREKAKNPNFDDEDERDIRKVLNRSARRRREDQQRFEEEKAEGFHVFSQADANRIIGTLQAPGEEQSFS